MEHQQAQHHQLAALEVFWCFFLEKERENHFSRRVLRTRMLERLSWKASMFCSRCYRQVERNQSWKNSTNIFILLIWLLYIGQLVLPQVVLLLLATSAQILKPFLRTPTRVVTTVTMIMRVMLMMMVILIAVMVTVMIVTTIASNFIF